MTTNTSISSTVSDLEKRDIRVGGTPLQVSDL